MVSVVAPSDHGEGTSLDRRSVRDHDLCDGAMDVFSIRYSPDNRLLACACADGTIRVLNSKTGRLAHHLNVGPNAAMPITCIRFRPTTYSQGNVQNILIASCADGSLQHFHCTTQQRLHRLDEPGNEIYAVDFNRDGDVLATGGHDGFIRLYDEGNKTLIRVMGSPSGIQNQNHGHTSRVFSARFAIGSGNILCTGGWDNTIQVWDIRSGRSERYIYGPHIAGDAIDTNDLGQIITGSWRPENQLQIWDMGTGKLLEDIGWAHGAMVYSLAASGGPFAAPGSLVAAGSNPNSLALFDHNRQIVGNGDYPDTVRYIPRLCRQIKPRSLSLDPLTPFGKFQFPPNRPNLTPVLL